jgi:hypothetical protein
MVISVTTVATGVMLETAIGWNGTRRIRHSVASNFEPDASRVRLSRFFGHG